jgi:hypothetical protein
MKTGWAMSTLSNPAGRAGAFGEAVLWMWLAAGILACLIFPALRTQDALLGWLPFWLIAAPLIDLGLIHRNGLSTAARTFLVSRARRRRPARQARRLRRDQSLMPRRFFSMRRRNSDMMRRYKSSPR